MNPILKRAVIATSICTTLFLTSCGNEEKKDNTKVNKEQSDTTAHSSEHIYACPMHSEVRGKENDKCPKCGMALEHNDNLAKSNGYNYTMRYISTPSQLDAGKEGLLSFTPKIKEKENEQCPLDVHHEKKIHLIIVSNDLSYFEHIHPEFNASGNYDIKVLEKGHPYTISKGHNETRFDNGGEYTMFADYSPTGGPHQVEKIVFNVSGKAKSIVTYKENNLKSEVDGYVVTLEPEGGKFITNQLMHIVGIIKQNGKQVEANQFENYLGAKAHMVVVGLEDKAYLHVHPEVNDGKLDLHTTFDKPGIYRGWLQFQTNGKVHAAQFTLKVEQGTGEKKMENNEEHKAH